MKPKIQTNKKGVFLVTNKEKIKMEKTNPYLKGFNHGLKKGYENNPYSMDAYRWLYKVGYDAGVSEYCHINHPEDENK
jgi:hypothetical protein